MHISDKSYGDRFLEIQDFLVKIKDQAILNMALADPNLSADQRLLYEDVNIIDRIVEALGFIQANTIIQRNPEKYKRTILKDLAIKVKVPGIG